MIFLPFMVSLVIFVDFGVHTFPIAEDAPHLAMLPPTVVLQSKQNEVEVNCSAWSQDPASLQWIIISLYNQVITFRPPNF